MSNNQVLHIKITGDGSSARKEMDAIIRDLDSTHNKVNALGKNASNAKSSLGGLSKSAASARVETDNLGKSMGNTARKGNEAANELEHLKNEAIDLTQTISSLTQKAENFKGVVDAVVKGLGSGGAAGAVSNLQTLMQSPAFQVWVLQKALATLADTAKKAIRYFAESWKEASAQMVAYADLIQDGAAATKKITEKTEKYMARLGELLRQEKLSNVEKLEMSDLLERLDGGFTHIGKSIDTARGNLKQFDKDMAKLLDKNKGKRIERIDDEIAALHHALDEEAKIQKWYNSKIAAGVTNGDAAKYVQESLAKEAQIHKRINGLLAERNELTDKNPGTDYTRRRAAEEADKRAEQRAKQQEARKDAMKALSEASDELDLSEYARKRKAAVKKYKDMAKDLRGDPKAMANLARLRAKELAKIDKEEADKRAAEAKKKADAEKVVEKSVHDARKVFLDAEKNMRKTAADERIAQAKRAADAEIKQLKRVRDKINDKLSNFGFKLDVKPDEKPKATRRRVRRSRLDASIAKKQVLQASGKRTHYTRRERRRIGQYRRLQAQGKKIDKDIAAIEAAQKQREAAATAKASAERLAEAAQRQKDAALKLQEAVKGLPKPQKPGQNQPQQKQMPRNPQKPGIQSSAKTFPNHPVKPVQRQPVAPITASSLNFSPNYTPQLTAILTAVNNLKSNTYIVK